VGADRELLTAGPHRPGCSPTTSPTCGPCWPPSPGPRGPRPLASCGRVRPRDRSHGCPAAAGGGPGAQALRRPARRRSPGHAAAGRRRGARGQPRDRRRAAVLDFKGTAGVTPWQPQRHPGHRRQRRHVRDAALVDVDLPLNEGLLEPSRASHPRGPAQPRFVDDPGAMAGGRRPATSETEQPRLVDTLLEALRLAGCSQGTMNNVSFGEPASATTKPWRAAAARDLGSTVRGRPHPHEPTPA